MTEDKKIEDSSPYDPVDVAKAEGKVFGAGASGQYKKTFVTRLGFIMLGIVLLGMGILSFFMALEMPREEWGDYVVRFFMNIMGFGGFYLGFVFIKNALKRKD